MGFDDLQSRFLRKLADTVAKAPSILFKSQRSGKVTSDWKKTPLTFLESGERNFQETTEY